MGIDRRVGEQVRLAVGLLTAMEWDSQTETPDMEHTEAYLAAVETQALDLIIGLAMLARAGLSVAGADRQRDLSNLLRGAAARAAAWR